VLINLYKKQSNRASSPLKGRIEEGLEEFSITKLNIKFRTSPNPLLPRRGGSLN